MRNRPQLVIGALLVVWGVFALLGTLFHINFWAFCWPALLIVIGVWLVFRPRFAPPGTGVDMRILGDIKRYGRWQVRNEEFWIGIGGVDLDFSSADVPGGETVLRVYGLIGDVDLIVPQEIGLLVTAGGFLVSAKIQGNKQDSFLSPFTHTSPTYFTADRKVRVELIHFITDLTVRSI